MIYWNGQYECKIASQPKELKLKYSYLETRVNLATLFNKPFSSWKKTPAEKKSKQKPTLPKEHKDLALVLDLGTP